MGERSLPPLPTTSRRPTPTPTTAPAALALSASGNNTLAVGAFGEDGSIWQLRPTSGRPSDSGNGRKASGAACLYCDPPANSVSIFTLDRLTSRPTSCRRAGPYPACLAAMRVADFWVRPSALHDGFRSLGAGLELRCPRPRATPPFRRGSRPQTRSRRESPWLVSLPRTGSHQIARARRRPAGGWAVARRGVAARPSAARGWTGTQLLRR